MIHIFTDASSLAYRTVAYCRTISNFGIEVSFIIAKSRLTPLKKNFLSISKLGLQAALIASRLKVKILDQRELKNIKKTFIFGLIQKLF